MAEVRCFHSVGATSCGACSFTKSLHWSSCCGQQAGGLQVHGLLGGGGRPVGRRVGQDGVAHPTWADLLEQSWRAGRGGGGGERTVPAVNSLVGGSCVTQLDKQRPSAPSVGCVQHFSPWLLCISRAADPGSVAAATCISCPTPAVTMTTDIVMTPCVIASSSTGDYCSVLFLLVLLSIVLIFIHRHQHYYSLPPSSALQICDNQMKLN